MIIIIIPLPCLTKSFSTFYRKLITLLQYLGTWHVMEILATEPPQSTCSRFDWSGGDTAGHYVVDNTQVEELRLKEVINGTVTDASSAKMTINFINPDDNSEYTLNIDYHFPMLRNYTVMCHDNKDI